MGTQTGSQRRVLVVEDEEILVDVLCTALSDLLVDVATNGTEAWRKLREERYDVMIADYNLPGIHGRDLLRMMFEKGIDVPTVVISGMPIPVETMDVLRTHRHHIMLKPFRLETIREQVMSMLDDNRKPGG